MQQILLTWYDANRRYFPWRTTPINLYYVFLSEIMLQQTTTKTVVPYFLRFIEKYPDLKALQTASLDDIYHLWQGLGYYSRARNLHRAVSMIDVWPLAKEEWMKLPGIGEYTSSAICAIAFNHKYLPMDGNIRRVMARFYGLNEPCGPILDKAILNRVVVQERAGDLCQALMDFANTICLPKKPKCEVCPLNQECSKQIHLPIKKEKPLKRKLYTQAFIIKSKNGIWLSQHQQAGLLKGLWGPPMLPFCDMPFAKADQYLGTVRHIFTHIDLHVDIYGSNLTTDEGVWVQDVSSMALSTLAKKVLRFAKPTGT